MTHEGESELQPAVVELLRNHYGPGNVEEEVHLDETDRFADVVVDASEYGRPLEPDSYVVEVEDDPEGAIESVGQVRMYAAELGAEPVIVVPEGHFEQPEIQYLQETVRFITMDV